MQARAFHDHRLLMILSVLLIIVSFSGAFTAGEIRKVLLQKQAEIMLMQSAADEGREITDPDFALYFPEQVKVKKGETFSLFLYLLTKEPVESFAAYFTFDPKILSIKEITPANNFQRYPEIFYDNGKGGVRLVAETDQEFQGDQEVATFQFLAKESGRTQLYFSLNKEGRASHILQKGANVIEAVGDAEVIVQEK